MNTQISAPTLLDRLLRWFAPMGLHLAAASGLPDAWMMLATIG
jgi:hypothetical protein